MATKEQNCGCGQQGRPHEKRELFLLIEVFIKIITDSYVIIRNNTERSLVLYTSFTPVITFAKL